MSALFHPLRVRAVQPDTQEAVIVSFDVPEDLREVFGFTQGQYLTLRKEIDGQDLRRSYSICAGVDDGELRVGVRKVNGGVFSNWINAYLKVGDTLQVMAPQGRFFVPIEPQAKRQCAWRFSFPAMASTPKNGGPKARARAWNSGKCSRR